MQSPNNIPINDELHDLPELRQKSVEPKGVLHKNLKVLIYLGAAALVIIAAFFSSGGKKTPTGQTTAVQGARPQPTVQDNTDNNVQDLKNQLAAERLKEQQQATMAAASVGDPTLATATPAQQATAAAYSPNGQPIPCIPGQPCTQAGYGQQNVAQPQLTPAQQQAQQLAAKERELAYNSRFASNLAYSRPAEQSPQSPAQNGGVLPTDYQAAQSQTSTASAQPGSSFGAPRQAGEQQPG